MGIKMKEKNVEKLIDKIDAYVRSHVSDSRYEHSVRTAQTAQRMCCIYGLSPRIGYLAGISHDMCKSMSDKKLISLSKKDGMPFLEVEIKRPSLLHGRAAAVLLKKKFHMKDENVIEAVASHTFGRKGMNDLAKILFAADKVEPGREHISEEYLQELFSMEISKMLKKVLSESFVYLESKGKKPAPVSVELYESL